MARRRRVSEARWARRVLELATFLAEECLTPDLFPRFLEMLARDFPLSLGVLDFDATQNLTELATWRLDASEAKAYAEYYHAINPFARTLTQQRLYNHTFVLSRWINARELLRSEFYNDFLRPRGERYLMVSSIAYPDGSRTGLPMYRGDGEGGDFTSEEARRLDMLRPFIKNAVLLRRLSRQNGLIGSCARVDPERLPVPAMTTKDETLRPLNDAAEALLINGSRADLAQRIPLPSNSWGKHAYLPILPASAQLVFARKYGLSPREAEVAALLCDGLTYEEVANRLTISRHTVNSHVKSLLRKLNLSSIRRLPRLLVADPETA